MSLEPGQVIGKYTVESTLGQGALAVTFKVVDSAGAPYALKVMYSRDESFLRQEWELSLGTWDTHANIAGCRSTGTTRTSSPDARCISATGSGQAHPSALAVW